ncbi:hypothetical protein HK097_008965 [Rhizophlyctis rosea]|uniref:Coiled-coil domain-containing protein 43 n=1 Tax=Rhizophlyctis rosea TaxID=64517 RepID=A0AAD5X7Q5_9FUNG|nr:hypothetical protein HK097_008965 [Rhizophlyctis rosea]
MAAFAAADNLVDWVVTELASLSITDETFSEYITQLCTEETIEDDEKREIITEFLAEATVRMLPVVTITPSAAQLTPVYLLQDKPVGPFVDSLLQRNQQRIEDAKRKEELDRKRILEEVKEKELQALQADKSSGTSEKKVLSKEEKRARDRVLAQYAYDLDEVVENDNGEVEILYKGAGGSEDKGVSSDPLLMKNRNADVVKEAEAAKRAKAQSEHQRTVARNKELQEKQKLEKEKEKRRTMKKEKRRM